MRRPGAARPWRSRTACESSAPGPAVRRRLRGVRLSGGTHRSGHAARGRAADRLDVHPDHAAVRRGMRVQRRRVAARDGGRAESAAVLARLGDHRGQFFAQLHDPARQRGGRAVQDRRRRAVVGPAARRRVGGDLSDAPHLRHAAEFSHRGGTRADLPAPHAVDRRAPGHRVRRARRAHAPAPHGTSTGHARLDGRADHPVLPCEPTPLPRSVGARVRQPLPLHGRVPAHRVVRGTRHRLRPGVRHRRPVAARPERAVCRAVRSGHEGRRALPPVPAAGPRPGARRVYRHREPGARPRVDRSGRRPGLALGAPGGAGRSRRAVTVFTHFLATTLGVQAMGLEGRDKVLAYAFGMGVDIDHAVKAPLYLRAIGLRDKRGYYWRSSLQEPVALLWIVPLCVFLGTPLPILFFAIHVAMDYSIRFEKMPFYPYSPWVTRGWLTSIPDKAKEGILFLALLAGNVGVYWLRHRV